MLARVNIIKPEPWTHPQYWEEEREGVIFKYICKGFVSRLCKELLQLNKKIHRLIFAH